jgi:hypothetical protein
MAEAPRRIHAINGRSVKSTLPNRRLGFYEDEPGFIQVAICDNSDRPQYSIVVSIADLLESVNHIPAPD